MKRYPVSAERTIQIVKPQRNVAGIALGVALFAMLTAVGAYVRIPLPFTPVPITMQVMFVLLCGAALGPVYGTMAQALYVFIGILGLPAFSALGGGFSYFLGPTGGYIFGFVVAQVVVGSIISKRGSENASFLRVCLAMAAGLAVIHLFGALHLKTFLSASWTVTLSAGFIPFIFIDALKAASAVCAFMLFRDKLRYLCS
jgi:biotin transport system substrate-specific component